MPFHRFQIQTKTERVDDFCRLPRLKFGQLKAFDSSTNQGVNEYLVMNYSHHYN